MIKFFNIKTPLATHSICVHKSTIKDLWTVDIVAYGEWYSKQFRTLKECFNFIREIFNKEKKIMAKTKLNKEKRSELKRIVRMYIQREFNKDEEFIRLKNLLTNFQKCAQDEFDRVTNCTEDVKKFLKGMKLYGSCTIYNESYSYYNASMEIQAPYSYNTSILQEYIKDKTTYITDNDFGYDYTISIRRFCEKYLESLLSFNKFEEEMAELNKKYFQMQEKMSVIVDNCKYLEDVKEYLPIDEVNKYVDECLYNCNTFISVVTSEDINLVKDFINKSKK